MKPINYTCRYCGAINTITTFWQWLKTPHFGSKKHIKCKECGHINFMEREDRKYKWLDWYK